MNFEIGKTYEGEVIEIRSYGAILRMADNTTALLHISNIADHFVHDIEKFIHLGDTYTVTAVPGKVRAIDLILKKVDIDAILQEEANQSFDVLLERYLPRPDSRDKKIHRKYNKEKSL